MQTLVCAEPGKLVFEDRTPPEPRADEALIRIRRVGVCGSDYHIFRGRQPFLTYPRVMGHEFSGEVVAAPAGSGLNPGDTVCVLPYLSCGECVACRKGKTNCCVKLQLFGIHRDGAFTEYLNVPTAFALKTPHLSFDDAAMVEFLAVGAHGVRRTQVARGDRVLVVGAGPIGLAAALFCKLRGASVTVIDAREDRLEFARKHLAVDHTVVLSSNTPETLRQLTDDAFFDVVFDATGNPQAMEMGFGYVAHGGRYGLISVVTSDIRFSDPEFHKREITLYACRNATLEDFQTVIDAIAAGSAPTAAFRTHRGKLSEVPELLPRWLEPTSGVIKAVVEI